MTPNTKPIKSDVQDPVGEYEPSADMKQTDLAEGELETVEECLRQHEKKGDLKVAKSLNRKKAGV